MQMSENKTLKKDAIILSISVILLLSLVIGVSYSYFMSIDKGKDNVISIGDLNVSFCNDKECTKKYSNFGQVIGTKMVDGKSVIESIYPYASDEEALNSTPYIFNIKNTGSLKTYLTIRLKEDDDYILGSGYEEYKSLTEMYSNHIKIAISNCDEQINKEDVVISNYGTLEDNVILDNELFNSGEDKTYCLWTYLDNTTPNEVQNTYFVANLDFKAEYKPN